MKIKKQLKNIKFEYDEESKKFFIIDPENGNTLELNKVYAFAFMRFVVRMAQRNWLRSKKVVDKSTENMLEYEDIENPSQMEIFN
jgi:hypothetical protein